MALKQMIIGASLLALTAATCGAERSHYTGFPHQITDWTAEHFSPHEFASKGNGKVHVSRRMIDALDQVREAVGHPLRITSGYRDPQQNRRVGGARQSRHMVGDAVDIDITGLSDTQRYFLMWHLLAQGFTSFGSYEKSFIHADMRPLARVWHHGAGTYPNWFLAALKDWGWQRDHGPTRIPKTRLALN